MIIDLRSDTVTKPTAPMLEAMMRAEVGDDVFAEDPTVNLLQEKLADMFGKEAGLFCPSGTMTNQLAIGVHTRPGDEVICDRLSHIYNYEGGGIARNSGASVRLIHGDQGRFTVEQIQGEVNPADSHYSRTSLVAVEDTCNKGGGAIYDFDELKRLSEFARSKGLGFHLDGARAFNAIVEMGYDTKEYGRLFDSISICLSKGLGTPAGSVLLGSTDFIREAHRGRKVMGGGMRQVGILAAAGIYALDHHLPKLKEDNDRAKAIGEILAAHPKVSKVYPVQTNIVIFQLHQADGAEQFCASLEKEGIRSMPFGPDKVRFVFHHEIGDDHLERLKDILQAVTTA